MQSITIESRDEAATAALGRALAAVLPDGTTVALDGTLGAGKTRLVQAVALGVGVEPGVAVSPTFVLVQEYHGARSVVHVDAYRLRDADELLELGGEELFAAPALILIEWAARVASCLPREYVHIEVEETGVTSRRFVISARGGTKYEAALARLAGEYERQVKEPAQGAPGSPSYE